MSAADLDRPNKMRMIGYRNHSTCQDFYAPHLIVSTPDSGLERNIYLSIYLSAEREKENLHFLFVVIFF